MKISIENGTVLCSLDNKNSSFLAECSGIFDGFLHGKLKLYDYINVDGMSADGIIEANALLVGELLQIAAKYGVEVSDQVKDYNNVLQKRVREIEGKEHMLEEERECTEKWEGLCKHGCGRCKNLTYYIDVPKCKKTGEELKDKPVPKAINGIMYLFNMVAFPSENCPFNNKKQGVKNEHLREYCGSTS